MCVCVNLIANFVVRGKSVKHVLLQLCLCWVCWIYTCCPCSHFTIQMCVSLSETKIQSEIVLDTMLTNKTMLL